jgi:dTDP-4-dehydrorhamnose reductase
MREIRAVRPGAQLIQTEDLGRTYATRALAHQASFDNARRWMTWDLLEGRVTPGHELWARLDQFGFGDRLRQIADDPCPADLVGVNHYLTSDRFLDHRIPAYPATCVGGNEFMAYADVEAVRAVLPAPGGLSGVLEEVWARYARPFAVTECHNGCTREEQLRWIRETWDTAGALRARGADIRAVTAWALLGSLDWNSLLTRADGHYEVGAFDVREQPPRATAIAHHLSSLGAGAAEVHPAAAGPGWWRRDIRLRFNPVFRSLETPEPRADWSAPGTSPRPLLITGATGTLGRAFARACEWRGLAYRLVGRTELNLDDEDAILRCLDAVNPWAVINAAGWVRVDDAQAEPDACRAANAVGALRLARACRAGDTPLATFSSDLVFDGRIARPYVESDPVGPLNVYGQSKAQAERAILELGGRALVIRTAAFFSAYDPHNFAADVVRTLSAGKSMSVADDLVISPTHVPDLVDASLDLLIDGETGLRHLANSGALTWAAFGEALASALDLDPKLVLGAPSAAFGWAAPRPAYAPLGTERGVVMPNLVDAIGRFSAAIRESGFAAEGTSTPPDKPAAAFSGVSQ